MDNMKKVWRKRSWHGWGEENWSKNWRKGVIWESMA